MTQNEMHLLALGLKPRAKVEDPMRIEALRDCLKEAVGEIENLKAEIIQLKRRVTKLTNANKKTQA